MRGGVHRTECGVDLGAKEKETAHGITGRLEDDGAANWPYLTPYSNRRKIGLTKWQ